ncbi:hypothetical protein HN954_01385 [bacterium]|nr:hypothetical protein [bacterium]
MNLFQLENSFYDVLPMFMANKLKEIYFENQNELEFEHSEIPTGEEYDGEMTVQILGTGYFLTVSSKGKEKKLICSFSEDEGEKREVFIVDLVNPLEGIQWKYSFLGNSTGQAQAQAKLKKLQIVYRYLCAESMRELLTL